MSDKVFKIVAGDISDGYHTFDELYAHRCILFVNLCLMQPEKCAWRNDYDGWFVLYLETSSGQISYHIPHKNLCLIEGKIKCDPEHKFDGHTSSDVVFRLECEASK